MNFVELFAGSAIMSKVAAAHGFRTMTTDAQPFLGINLVSDVRTLRREHFPPTVNVLWASPPCTTFSVASIGHHWKGGYRAYVPKSEAAKEGLAILHATLRIIEMIKPDVWFIENPRGLMRKMPCMQNLPRHTVTYCQYGEKRMKPTDIWTNSMTWQPRPMCRNGAPCHEAAPRGSRTGTQGLSNNYERSKLPVNLCEEIVCSTLKHT